MTSYDICCDRNLRHLWQSPAASDAIDVVRRFAELDPAVIGYADHYCTVNIEPFWAIVQVPVVVIGNHTFYKLN